MRIYVLILHDFGDSSIVSVHATEDAAGRAADRDSLRERRWGRPSRDSYEISPHEVEG